MFERRVVPVLAARGIVARGSSFDQIAPLLHDQLRAWAVTIRRPNVGAIAKVDFSRHAPQVLDCRIRVPDLPEEIHGDVRVRIRGVFGMTAFGVICDEGFLNAAVMDGPTLDSTESRNAAWVVHEQEDEMWRLHRQQEHEDQGSRHADWENFFSLNAQVANKQPASPGNTARKLAGVTQDKLPDSCTLLALTCREVTLLADVLPGKDCWIAVAVWPNELVPMSLVLQRPRKFWFVPTDRVEVKTLERDRAGFATACPKCNGFGTLDCRRCQGSGIHKPRRTCPKCNGSGNFIGKYGDVMGDCRACDGRGHWPQTDCNACDGSGSVECYRCHGTGFLHARFSQDDGAYSISQRERDGHDTTRILVPSEITIYDWEIGAPHTIGIGAVQMLQEDRDATGTTRACDPKLSSRIAEHCRQIKEVDRCLIQSLEARDFRETRPICVGRPGASVRRSQGGVVYEFPVISGNSRKWVREGLLPFPRNTPVQLERLQGEGRPSPIDVTLQTTPNIGNPVTPILVDCSGQGRSYRLAIRFPVEIDPSSLLPEAYLRPAIPPPSELTQLRHLHRWCGQDNWDHPALHAIACPNHDEKPSRRVALRSASIATFPRQVEAVQLGVSDLPLALIKGPPGTGKTTIITEVVRQLLARGQRVLICSQTHTAVQNVLERLHREGGVRMIRHGNDTKLTDLEKRYRAGGLEDEYCTSVRQRSQVALEANQKQLHFLERATEALPLAREAAVRLADVRHQAATELERLAKQRTKELSEANHLLSQQLEEVRTKAQTAIQDSQQRDRTAKRNVKQVQKALGKTESRRDATEGAHVRKVGKKPELIETPSSWRQILRDTLLPNWIVGATALQERFSRCCRQLDALRPVERKILDEIAAIATETEAIGRNLEQAVAEFMAKHTASTSAAETRCMEQESAIRQQSVAEETRLRAIQSAAIPFATDVKTLLTDDSTAESWRTAAERAANGCRSTSERVDFLARWLRDIESEPDVLMTYCWDHLQVFFSTCVGLASWRRLVERGTHATDLVIIDEAAHATAPETLIPMLYSRRVLLIGDEMQLPPLAPSELGKCETQCPVVASIGEPRSEILRGDIAAAVQMSPCWLERSLFEWLWRNCRDIPRVMLDTQFRMHSAIADFVGSVFYPEGLRTAVDESKRTIAFGEFNRPVCLIPTSAYQDRFEEFLDPGYRNYLEAKIVRRVLEKAEMELTEPQSFGVITPYAHQVELILKELDTILPSLQKVRLVADDVASVDSFQGSERDVILISFARSPASCNRCEGNGRRHGEACSYCDGKGWRGTGLTFARDLRRLNVAFSRARKMLILVGDIYALTDSRYRGGAPGGHVLSMFRDYVGDHGKVLHLWEREYDSKQ